MMSSGGYTSIGDDRNGTSVSGTVPVRCQYLFALLLSDLTGSRLFFLTRPLSPVRIMSPSSSKSPTFRPFLLLRIPRGRSLSSALLQMLTGFNFVDTFSKPVRGSSDEPQQSGWMHAFTVGAYKPYFDVDTADVLERIKDSLFPFRGTFTDKTSDNPDLYGPFWICTTLVFVAAAIGTFVTYLAHRLQHKEWEYDINLVTWSAGLFYGYVTFVPLGLYIILKYFSAPSGLVQLWCLYGYSLFVFVPALCLSIVPVEIFRWVIVGVAGFMSATFVALNLRTHIVSSGERWFLIVAGIFLLQLALAVVLKLYFFTITV